MNDALAPYAHLTPDVVIDALASVNLPPDGRLLALNSYENRVFQIGLDDGRMVVAKFYRPGRWSDAQILEEHAFALQLAEEDIPLVPPMALQASGAHVAKVLGEPTTLALYDAPEPDSADSDAQRIFHRFAVSARRGGREPELDDPEVLAWIGRLMARLHAVGRQAPFEHRPTLGVEHMGRQALQWLAQHGDLPHPQRDMWLQAAGQALDLAQTCFDRVPGLRMGRIHGDCHLGNVMWTPDGPHFVDLDDACNGPAVQDLWMLLGGHRRDRQAALYALMDGYETLHEFDWREWSLVEALRTLRLIHHSAWLARRWSDPAFPAAFAWFAQPTYWQQQADQMRQQILLMQEELESPGFG